MKLYPKKIRADIFEWENGFTLSVAFRTDLSWKLYLPASCLSVPLLIDNVGITMVVFERLKLNIINKT